MLNVENLKKKTYFKLIKEYMINNIFTFIWY